MRGELIDHHGESRNIADYEGQWVYVGHINGGSRCFIQDGVCYDIDMGYNERVNPSQCTNTLARQSPQQFLKQIPQADVNKISNSLEPSPIEVEIREHFRRS